MALRTGWVVDDWRESFWYGDPSIDIENTPAEDLEKWKKDGDRAHLRVKNGGTEPPTTIRYRALTAEERAALLSISMEKSPPRAGESKEAYAERIQQEGSSWARMLLYAFRAATEFVGVPQDMTKRVRERGIDLLPLPFVNALARHYGDEIWMTIGTWVWNASMLTEDEKKTS